MNTTKKGDTFENKSYRLIIDALHNGSLGVIPAQCKVFTKKGYYSKDREGDIIFDLTIEVWPPDADRYTLLLIIECKSYSHKVPVSDVEEFYSKINQVAGAHLKGIIITDNSFQEGAYKFARSKGMMLIEAGLDESYNIILHKVLRENKFTVQSTDITESIDSPSCLLSTEESSFLAVETQLVDFIIKLFEGKIGNQNKITGLNQLSSSGIEKITNRLLSSFNKSILVNYSRVPVEDFISFLEKTYLLKTDISQSLGRDANNRIILGYYDMAERTIFIDKSLAHSERFSFIFAHEVGHFILHKKLKINNKVYNNFKDPEFNFKIDKYELTNDKNWIEWQANQFAASLVIPKESLLYRLISYQTSIGITRNRGRIFLDDQPVNHKDYYRITTFLAYYFKVSRANIRYRLNNLGVVINASTTGKHWTNYYDELDNILE